MGEITQLERIKFDIHSESQVPLSPGDFELIIEDLSQKHADDSRILKFLAYITKISSSHPFEAMDQLTKILLADKHNIEIVPDSKDLGKFTTRTPTRV